jgi:Flp pilus assembly pilin Flp
MLVEAKKRFRKAQSTVEYGILIGVIVAAAVAMQTYIKRSIQAKHKDAADMLTSVGGQVTFNNPVGDDITVDMATTPQYEPYYLRQHQQQTVNQDSLSKHVEAGGRATTSRDRTVTRRSASVYGFDTNMVNAGSVP